MTPPRNPGTHDLTTRRVKLSTLRPHPRNARNGDVEAVAESLTVNGQYRPIVVTTDGTILAGNHTYAAALSLGWDRIAAVTVDVAPESPEALRIMLADNRTADLGGYDDAILVTSLGSVPVRAGRQFVASRVLGRTHQQVLVYVKGSRKRAAEACGVIDVTDALDTGDAP